MTPRHQRIVAALAILLTLLFAWPCVYGLWLIAQAEWRVNCNNPANQNSQGCIDVTVPAVESVVEKGN